MYVHYPYGELGSLNVNISVPTLDSNNMTVLQNYRYRSAVSNDTDTSKCQILGIAVSENYFIIAEF